MKRGFHGAALGHLTRLFEAGSLAAASDRELLAEFQSRRDEAAFEALVGRYGRLVLNIGRKLLHDAGDVEDAFQATFLVLVRKPPRLRVGESLGPWISTVAYRVAARACANRIRLNRMETTGGQDAVSSQADDSNAVALHEEVSRLPDRLRRPVVFCYLEGLTHERAAERLGCPVGTVRSRLARARSLLHRRLVARGVAPVIAPLEALHSCSRPVDPSLRLVDQTLRLATASHVRWAEAGVASASLLSLVNGVVRMMKLKKALVACSLLFPVGFLAAAGAQAYQQATDGPDRIVVGGKTFVAAPEGPETVPKTYYVGDLIGLSSPSDSSEGGSAPTSQRPQHDLVPLIRLIARHVEPGTWKVLDNTGNDISASSELAQNNAGGTDRRIGSITPFFLSISLIVRHTEETHKEVASLLEDVRALKIRAKPTNADQAKAPQARTEVVEVAPHGKVVVHRDSIDQAPTGRFFIPTEHLADFFAGVPSPGTTAVTRIRSQSAKKDRLRQLLQQLQSELESMDTDDAPTPPQRDDRKRYFEPSIQPLDSRPADRPRKPS